MNDCIFCKIIAGEVPADKVYEDDTTIAFIDVHPINPGHTLVVPKKHYENILDTPKDVLAAMIQTAQKVAKATMAAVDAPAVNIGMNNGAEAGQVVFHSHFHVIPRFANDGYKSWERKEGSLLTYDKASVEKIRNAFK
ncbi:MAG: HIT family protein [Patescibacteria group bacterium]